MSMRYDEDMFEIVNSAHGRAVMSAEHFKVCVDLAHMAGWQDAELNCLAVGFEDSNTVCLNDASAFGAALRRIVMDCPELVPPDHSFEVPLTAELITSGPLTVTKFPAGSDVPGTTL